jgi:hypothetical protein
MHSLDRRGNNEPMQGDWVSPLEYCKACRAELARGDMRLKVFGHGPKNTPIRC